MNTRPDTDRTIAEQNFKKELLGFVDDTKNLALKEGVELDLNQLQNLNARITKSLMQASTLGVKNPDPAILSTLKNALNKLIESSLIQNAELRLKAKQAVGETLKAVQEQVGPATRAKL